MLTRDDSTPIIEHMENITVAIDAETYRRARVKAAERGSSVSALVKAFLTKFAREADQGPGMRRAEDQIRAQIDGFRAGSRLTRSELHNRDI